MIAARSGGTDITNILLEGEHIDLDIQENVSALLQAPNTSILYTSSIINPTVSTDWRMVSSPLLC